MQAVVEQAAVLDTAPKLASGSLDLNGNVLAKGAFVWIEVEQDGLYSLSMATPGALVLGSFPTVDGRYDGKVRPVIHNTAKSLTEALVLTPLLLSTSHPYLLSVSSSAGAGTVQLTLLKAAPALSTTPENNTEVLAGEALYSAPARLILTVPGNSELRRIEVIGEPRAKLRATLGGLTVTAGGRYPWLSTDDTPLRITTTVDAASPPPRVLVRMAASDVALDESEPNEKTPSSLELGAPFKGHLLQGDRDRLAFALEEDMDLELSISIDQSGEFAVDLLSISGKQETLLLRRKLLNATVTDAALSLTAGQYALLLSRVDRKDVPLPYSVMLAQGPAARPNRETEPNDTVASAMPLPDSLRVSGAATPQDLDVYRFTVPDDKVGHLWRVFAMDAHRIELTDDDGRVADVSASGRRSMADSLALNPGIYWVTVHAKGDYLLRVLDQGPRPTDFEGEPNDRFTDGQRLKFGDGIRGGFHALRDLDYYLFRLDSPSAVEININPAGDGPMDVKLFRSNSQIGQRILFEPGDGPYTFQSNLPAGDWALVVRALGDTITENYELSVQRLPAITENEPNDNPLDAVKMPMDGDFYGSVGAFDGADQIFIPLPEGEGQAALVCTNSSESASGLWRLYHWSDDSKVADIRDDIAIFPYGPELGGAVRLGMAGNERLIPYQCAVRFPPITEPPPVTPFTQDELEPLAEGTLNLPLSPGQTRRATITEQGPEPSFALQLEEGEMAFVACREGNGKILAADTKIVEFSNATTPTSELLGELTAVVAKAEPMLKLRRVYAQRYSGAVLPLVVNCTLYGVDDLPRPADMGPTAKFQIVETQLTNEAQKVDGAVVVKGPPPPGLEALIAREVPAKQAEGDLPVVIALESLPELAAFSQAGQQFTVQASVSNETTVKLPITVSFEITGEGWRVTPEQQRLTLAAGALANVTAEIIAPPWLIPSLSPGLLVRADADDAFNATLEKLTVSPSALPIEPMTYWHAPDALRGGLNVLHYQLGARLIDWGGEIPNEQMQKVESGIHDGLAPHIVGINLPPAGIAFSLAAKAEVAGVMIQLRSTTDPSDWPAEVEVYASESDAGWRRIAASELLTTHAPQYLVFDQAVTADRLRFAFPRCNAKCSQPWVQEIQAIATPGTHPEGLPPVNAADPELGGHVVWANHLFTGLWNNGLLIGNPAVSNAGWTRSKAPRQYQATIAFHQNRAALIQSVNWIGDPDDTARISAAQIEVSMEGPNGPWRPLGQLQTPPLGEDKSTLAFDAPLWARYLRFSFEAPVNETRFGPDAIEVIEAPGTSVIGLWEDDQPRAAYEAVHNIQPSAPVVPTGGPNRDETVALPITTPVLSSVVIERNEDWWRLQVPPGTPHKLRLEFERTRPLVVAELSNAKSQSIALQSASDEQVLEAVLVPGEYALRIYEPPRSVVISWDTSGSVAQYIPRALAAVRTWGRSLQPGRDALQLLPFGPKGFLLDEWAETPEVLEPVLRELPEEQSSDSEKAMQDASIELARRRGARGIVMMTDAENSMNPKLWADLLKAMPRVVSLSVDSSRRQNAAVLMDWANVNHGHFQRVIGPLGLADSLEMANALFRQPKAYNLTASLEKLVEPQGEATLTVATATEGGAAVGGVELILDASGSMLQKMEGRRRIDIAHDALTDLVRNTLPEGTPFAFRAFGLKEDACLSELIVPLGPLDRTSAAEAIAGVPAINLAKTAIADSIRAAGDDLADANPPRVVVLVTDGEETCEGDPEAAIAELRASGLDAHVNIVGFAIDDAALAETFAAWAVTGGGTYFDANSAAALKDSIAEALRPHFDITRTYLDGRTEVVGRIALGETLTVPAGNLTITPGSGASGSAVTVQALPEASITIDYKSDSGLNESGVVLPNRR